MGIGLMSQTSHACRAMQAQTQEDTVAPLLGRHCKKHRMCSSTLGNCERERGHPGSVGLEAEVTSSGESCFSPDSLYLAAGCGFFKPIRRPRCQGKWWPRAVQVQTKVLLTGSSEASGHFCVKSSCIWLSRNGFEGTVSSGHRSQS